MTDDLTTRYDGVLERTADGGVPDGGLSNGR